MPTLYLVGSALGFDGRDQLRVDLCVGFGAALAEYVRDQAKAPLDTEEALQIVAVAGFLAAAPLVEARWGLNVFTDDRSAWQVRGVVRHAGFPYDSLRSTLAAGDGHAWLAELALSTRNALAQIGVDLKDEVIIQLPMRLAAAGEYLDRTALSLGVQ